MLNQTDTTRRESPRIALDTVALTTRFARVAEVALCPDCEPAVTAIAADVAELLGEVTRLYGAVIVARRQSANRLAAIRAAVRAEADGEPDPVGFLRDEIADAIADSAGGQLPLTGREWCR